MAVKRGKQAIGANPRGASIKCSDCGTEVRKTIAVRVHHCPKWGLTIDRNWNAAINIKKRAMGGLDIAPLAGEVNRIADPVKQQISIAKLVVSY